MDSRIRAIMAVAAVGVASLASGSAVARTGARAGSLSMHAWGTAIEVPGTAAHPGGADSYLQSLGGEICLILPPSERTCRRLSQDVASRETLRNRKVINTKSAR